MVLDTHVKTASCSAYRKLKNLILEKRSDLKSDINKYGLEKLKGSGYVIHHFGESSHFIEVGRTYADYKKMIEILNNDQLLQIEFDTSKIKNYPAKTPLAEVGGDA